MKRRKVKLACCSVTGNVRKHNEDNICFFGEYLPEEHGDMEEILFGETYADSGINVAIFDGMGGEQAGEKASFVAAKVMEEQEPMEISNDEEIRQLFLKMNAAVCDEKINGGFAQIGTTVSLLIINAQTAWIANVGDSPIYLFRDGVLRQLSMPHIEIVGNRKMLTQCLGVDEEEFIIDPFITSEKIKSGDLYLLCSDGLTDMVSENDIQEILESPEDIIYKTDSLINKALQGGGRDNITVLLAEADGGSNDRKYNMAGMETGPKAWFRKFWNSI